MDIPKAPGLGLVLEKVHYSRYDKWYKKTHDTLDDWGDEINKVADDFRQRFIIGDIYRQEAANHSLVLKLHRVDCSDVAVIVKDMSHNLLDCHELSIY